jgi:hypothetical protein
MKQLFLLPLNNGKDFRFYSLDFQLNNLLLRIQLFASLQRTKQLAKS